MCLGLLMYLYPSLNQSCIGLQLCMEGAGPRALVQAQELSSTPCG